MSNVFTDEINNLVDLATDDHYEGSGVNDRTLGKMYYLKRYEKACQEEYDKLRREIDVPSDLVERRVIQNDKRFSAQAQLRQGSSKLDKALLHGELVHLLMKLDPSLEGSSVRAALAADALIDKCSTQGKDTVVISVIEDKRDE